ncbi:MIP/aquaporin family protein [Paenibacillus xerothermodurans]|uniref:Aquaporin family protein n=1 Tax=Paenibacillus xerothermodurans TaxID=1977292 RepID=A0A2W1P1D3_PAEXE|nr:MIP/aquaporin family protein [Paenibacillus xerothermodurans]PZE21552.1 aquaporin family protein [Paenibacillus xerothermodurans]
MSPFFGEVTGTMLLIILGGGVVAGVVLKRSKAHHSGWIVITVGWGLAVAMAVYAVGNVSGAHLNPAVTLGLAVAGQFPWADVPAYMVAQLIGGFLGAVVVWAHYLPHWEVTESPADKLSVFSTAPAIPHTLANLINEIIATFVLVFGVMAIGANTLAEGLNPLLVGLLVVSIGVSLGGTTGYAINPVRDFGPRLAHAVLPIAGKGDSNWGYAWVPIVGPLIGGVLGGFLYKLAFLS